MPVFHTKTIESILEPVALQVSRLVILHEEAEDGNAMPDLERPVQVVSRAVANLVKVGRETIASSDDPLLRQDMPSALAKVERASHLLEDAARMLKEDPYSAPARKRLIEGSGGILQATSALLLCFDESEVRKLVRECHRVLDYLAVAEVIETMEELVQFLRDLSPCLSKVSREVSAREKELTHQVHAEILVRCLEQVKTLAPILICGMKVFIHVVSSGGKGVDEAAENRNYLARRMSDEIHEIIRVLQLTTYDEDQSDLDNLTVLKKLSNAIQNKMNAANDWLMDPTALRGGIGEKSLRQILEHAERVAERCLPEDAASIHKQISSLHTMTDALCELRANLKSPTPQSESLSKGIREALSNLQASILSAIVSVDRMGLQQAAHTVSGRLEQARKWLSNPDKDDKGLGRRAIELIVEEGRKVAKGLPGAQQQELGELCDRVNALCEELSANATNPRAPEIARKLAHALHELKQKISHALVTRVVQDFMDVASPLKSFVDAVNVPEGTPGREQNFGEKAQALQAWSARAVKTAQMVAAGGSGGNKKLAESLLSASSQVESLTPQLISAGSLRMHYPQSKAADEHFDNLRQQWQDTVMRVRGLCDEATNSSDFIKASEEQMQKHTFLCEEAIRNKSAHKMVDNTSAIARLANRVLLVAKQESDNSEDPSFISCVNQAADRLQEAVPVMVAEAKSVAVNPNDSTAASRWREANKMLLGAVGGVRDAVMPQPELPPLPDVSALNINDPIKPHNYFAEKVGESVRQIPSPEPRRDLSPPHSHHGRISPLPKWARGDNSELLCRELADQNQSNREETAPPRPPLPTQDTSIPIRPPAPAETDDEDDVFHRAGAAGSQHPIMQAARGLHAEVRQWSSKDNAMVAAAKRMARLMARLSELVREDCRSSKRELIATAKQLAEAGEEVTRLAKLLARECTDKRIRTNLLQVCERIPTIGTQLKILSTVKATMLGAQAGTMGIPRPGSEEDREATEMLEGNAQNLMQSVKETVRAAEAASIKIHQQSQGRMQWVRRLPWYHY